MDAVTREGSPPSSGERHPCSARSVRSWPHAARSPRGSRSSVRASAARGEQHRSRVAPRCRRPRVRPPYRLRPPVGCCPTRAATCGTDTHHRLVRFTLRGGRITHFTVNHTRFARRSAGRPPVAPHLRQQPVHPRRLGHRHRVVDGQVERLAPWRRRALHRPALRALSREGDQGGDGSWVRSGLDPDRASSTPSPRSPTRSCRSPWPQRTPHE